LRRARTRRLENAEWNRCTGFKVDVMTLCAPAHQAGLGGSVAYSANQGLSIERIFELRVESVHGGCLGAPTN